MSLKLIPQDKITSHFNEEEVNYTLIKISINIKEINVIEEALLKLYDRKENMYFHISISGSRVWCGFYQDNMWKDFNLFFNIKCNKTHTISIYFCKNFIHAIHLETNSSILREFNLSYPMYYEASEDYICGEVVFDIKNILDSGFENKYLQPKERYNSNEYGAIWTKEKLGRSQKCNDQFFEIVKYHLDSKSVLEIGVFNGYLFNEHISKRNIKNYTGIEISEYSFNRFLKDNRFDNAVFMNKNFLNINEDEIEKADVVISLNLFQHFLDNNLLKAIENLNKVTHEKSDIFLFISGHSSVSNFYVDEKVKYYFEELKYLQDLPMLSLFAPHIFDSINFMEKSSKYFYFLNINRNDFGTIFHLKKKENIE